MSALTHAVYDTTNGDRASPDMTTEAAFTECAKLNSEHKGGYVVGPAEGLPGHRMVLAPPKPAADPETAPPQPEAPRAAVAQDPQGPGLFD